jgi:DNA-binding MarR family transcriptional regulator
MHAQALYARTINALANINAERYAALVSVTQDSVVTAWREMAACHAAACAALERELGERHGIGVSDFEVLERLAESEARKFRAQDLAESVHLSQSALSRLVDRLARHGLVERCGCEGDRRGVYVVLTEAGERRHAEAVPTHRSVLERLLPPALLTTANNRLG